VVTCETPQERRQQTEKGDSDGLPNLLLFTSATQRTSVPVLHLVWFDNEMNNESATICGFALVLMLARESRQDKLLGQTANHVKPHVGTKISEYKTRASTRTWVVGVGNGT
jgi:hypothetical protein